MIIDTTELLKEIGKQALKWVVLPITILIGISVVVRADDQVTTEPDGRIIVYFDKRLNRVAGVKCVGQTACDAVVVDVDPTASK